jgi:putative ABC transport system permease protein
MGGIMPRRILSLLRNLLSRKTVEQALDDELQSSVEILTGEKMKNGLAHSEARRMALIELGGVEQVKEKVRAIRVGRVLEEFARDIRYAMRQLRKNPGFACISVLILALGIGGVTAMFSTLYAVMIRPLPYTKPDRLVLGRATYKGDINPWLSGPDYVDYRDKSRSFTALEAFFALPIEVTITTGQTAERVNIMMASVGTFPALGVNMALGRPFTADEGHDSAPRVAIVSHDYWQKHFASQTDVAGRSVVIDGASYDIVGVTPPGLQFIQDVDVWFPLRPQNLGPRRFNNWFILGRLRDGVSLAEAQSEVEVIAAQLEKAYPDTNTNKALLLTPLQSAFTEQYRSSFGLLCGGVIAILLIAWANAAGLLLARGAGRQGELAVRTVMGASHWQLMRLLLTEALILAGAAGVAGTILAVWMQNSLLRLMPIEALFLGRIGLSQPVLLFVIAATVLTGLGFGLLPAWRSRDVNLALDLRSSGRGMQRHGVSLRGGLVAGQVAVSFVLLVVAGLLMRSFTSLHRADPGFSSRNLLTVEVPLSPGRYSDPQRSVFFASLLDRVRLLPGVVSAAAISQLPLRNPYNNISIYAADTPPTNPMEGGDGYQRVVLPGYFKTMGIPVLAGRDIQPADTADSRRVVVISQQLAKTLFPNRDPLGQKVVIDQANNVTWDVVGVVGDVKQSALREETGARGTFYRAHAQQPFSTMRLAVRTAGSPLAVVASLRTILQEMDRDVPLSGPRTMEEVMANSAISEKAQAVCLTTFSLLALTLAAVGIYGLLAYVVTRRTGEFGIRLSLGAQRADVIMSVLRDGLKTMLTGIGLGVVGAIVATRLIASELYGVAPLDPATFIVVGFVMVAVGILACSIPARRAAKVDPIVALRCE